MVSWVLSTLLILNTLLNYFFQLSQQYHKVVTIPLASSLYPYAISNYLSSWGNTISKRPNPTKFSKARRHHPGGQREHHEQAGKRTELITGMLLSLGHKVGADRCGVTQNSRCCQDNDEIHSFRYSLPLNFSWPHLSVELLSVSLRNKDSDGHIF